MFEPSRQYPSSWFAKNRKPTVYIGKVNVLYSTGKYLSVLEMKQVIAKGLFEDKLNWDLAQVYLAATARTITSVLDSDWTTYNVLIGKEKETISIGSLVDIQERDNLYVMKVASVVHNATDHDVLLLLLFLYRRSQLDCRAPTDLSRLVQKLREQLQSGDTELFRRVTRTEVLYHIDKRNISDLHKLAAAYDMFFNRFPDHHLSALGYWTGITRFKHCEALMSVRHVADLVGVEAEDIPGFIFHDATRKEFSKLIDKSDLEESTDPFSYFPYQIDFGLVSSSAYSSVAAPNTFCLMHMIGCFLGSYQSINARMIDKINIASVVVMQLNALSVAATYKKKKNSSGNNENPDLTELERYELILKPSSAMKRLADAYRDDVWPCREGTIGKFLQDHHYSDLISCTKPNLN